MRRLKWRGRHWRSWGFESTILLSSGGPDGVSSSSCGEERMLLLLVPDEQADGACRHRDSLYPPRQWSANVFPIASLFGCYVLHHSTSLVIGCECFSLNSSRSMSFPILSRSALVLPKASPASTISAIARARGAAAALSKRPSLSLNNGSTQVPRLFLENHRRQFSSSSATMASPSLTSIRSNCRKVH